MKRLIPGVLLGVLGLALLASTGQATRAQKEPIIIGVATAQSGFIAPFDVPGVAAAEIRRDEINAAGGLLGRPVKFVYANTRSDINESANAAVKVLNQGAQFLIVTCDFDFARGAVLQAAKKNVPSFSTCAGSPKYRTFPPGAYSMGFGTPTDGGTIAQWATEGKKSPKCKTAYILTDTLLDYSKSIGQTYIPRYFKGKIVGRDTFKNGDPSFQTQVTRLQSLDPQPDCIFLSSLPPGGVTMIRQLRASGLDQPIISPNAMDGDYWVNAIPNLSNMYAAGFVSIFGDDPRPRVNRLVRALEKKLKVKRLAASTAVAGYSVMEAYERAITRAGSTDPKKVRAEIEKFRNEQLLVGPTSFSVADRHGLGRAMAMIAHQNGKTRFLELFKPHDIRY